MASTDSPETHIQHKMEGSMTEEGLQSNNVEHTENPSINQNSSAADSDPPIEKDKSARLDSDEGNSSNNGTDQVDCGSVPSHTVSGEDEPMELDLPVQEPQAQSDANGMDVTGKPTKNDSSNPSISEDIPGTVIEAEPMETEPAENEPIPCAAVDDIVPDPEPQIPTEISESGVDEVDKSQSQNSPVETLQNSKTDIQDIQHSSRGSTPVLDEPKNGQSTVIDNVNTSPQKHDRDLTESLVQDDTDIKTSPGHTDNETNEDHENQGPKRKQDSNSGENHEREKSGDEEHAETDMTSKLSDELDKNTESKSEQSEPQDIKPKSEQLPTKPSSEGKDKEGKASKAPQQCIVCKKVGKCKYNIVRNGDIKHLCDDSCFKVFRANPTTYLRGKESSSSPQPPAAPVPAAAVESSTTSSGTSSPDVSTVLANCSFCSIAISKANSGKFTLTSGKEKFVFCGASCREDYMKSRKVCAFCNKNISKDPNGFMAPIQGSNEFKDFCSQSCLQSYETKPSSGASDADVEIVGTSKVPQISRVTRATSGQASCAVCGKMAPVKHEVNYDGKVHKLCGDPCFAAFRYANKLSVNTCENCGVYCYNEGLTPQTIQFEGSLKRFCSTGCVNAFKNGRKKITACAWCSTRKSNFDMIERVDANNKYQLFCSLNCLSLYRVNLQATSNQNVPCDQCRKVAPAQYHLTMSDASVRNFCSYNCVMAFQSQFSNTPNKAGGPGSAKKGNVPSGQTTGTTPLVPQSASQTAVRQSARQAAKVAQAKQQQKNQANIPVISNVMSLASAGQTAPVQQTPTGRNRTAQPVNVAPVVNKSAKRQSTDGIVTSGVQTMAQQVIVKPPPPKQVKNKCLLCKPFTQTKATSCRPHTQTKETQTEEDWNTKPALIPVPIPIYIPVPMAMYSAPAPYPMPVPVPVPVPCFIPTTKKSADSILKHIKEIQERMPADPFEAELLMMAEAVEKAEKGSDESSESDNEDGLPGDKETLLDAPTPAAEEEEVGEDMLQMALRIATQMPGSSDNNLDLENSLTPMPINPDITDIAKSEFSTIDASSDILSASRESPRKGRGGKRRGSGRGPGRPKRQRVEESAPDVAPNPVQQPTVSQVPPDANMVLKYTYGVNAWKHWVISKNTQLEAASNPTKSRLKLFKTDILQCTADELNYSLCLFVKEVRKPSGDEYAPDSIYYLCLGIQQYLFENGRIDNIFTDFYYEKFTECLNEVLQRYEVRLNEAGMIVCRIEEEHLWESKQLGAHSPHVLLNTLVYFNTKFFMLKTSEDHLNLSFSHIMKHWKKTNIPGSKTPGRSVYLRYYAPGTADGSKKTRREDTPVFEQGENVDNPLRCPVKLYEFYLSKCPESIKNRNDVFYLVPERSCVPDSPVWYSTASLGGEAMSKMLNRVRLVREIQEAALHTHPMYMN